MFASEDFELTANFTGAATRVQRKRVNAFLFVRVEVFYAVDSCTVKSWAAVDGTHASQSTWVFDEVHGNCCAIGILNSPKERNC